MSEENEVVEEATEVTEEVVEATETDVEATEEPQEAPSTDYEAKASDMGWVPQDEWRGDPKLWRPAEEFVKRGENLIPILNDRIKRLESDFKMAAKVNEQELTNIKKESYEKAKAEYDAKLVSLKDAEIRAFQEGDQEEFEKVREAKENLAPPKEVVVEEQNTMSPDFEPWVKKNPWYTEDKELHAYADNIGQAMVTAARENNEFISDAELYKRVESAVKAAFPAKFTNPKREEPSGVEGATPAPKKSDSKAFADLPSDAKGQYERMRKKFALQNREITKEQYAEAYYE